MASDLVFVCVLDGCGAGELPDAAAYGDVGSNTLRHVLEAHAASRLPNLAALGLGEVVGAARWGRRGAEATYGRLAERGAGKDTTDRPLGDDGPRARAAVSRPTRTASRPRSCGPFEDAIGRGVLCNGRPRARRSSSGWATSTSRTGRPIVYTSADSVFQIACHEDVVPVPQLYDWCSIARGILHGPHAVGRVIARPFDGVARARSGARRAGATSRCRRTGPTYLDLLHERGVPVVGVGKIGEIFVQRGVDVDDHTHRQHGRHRRLRAPPAGAGARAAVRQSGRLRPGLGPPQRRGRLRRRSGGGGRGRAGVARRPASPATAMILCADHGVDPTTPSTDHSREYSPLLALGLAPGRYDGC